MDYSTIITAVITSVSVSGLSIFFLKSYLKERVAHHFKVELEKTKDELARNAELRHDVAKWRVELYPIIIETTYRIRNAARKLQESISDEKLNTIEDLRKKYCDLEECLYRNRIYLDADCVFDIVHRYKNTIRNYLFLIEDLKYFIDHGEVCKLPEVSARVNGLYEEIDKQFTEIINKFSFKEKVGSTIQ